MGPNEKSTFCPEDIRELWRVSAGSDVARFVRKIVLGSIVEDGWRGKSGGWEPVRGPLQKGVRKALPTGVVVRVKGGRWM